MKSLLLYQDEPAYGLLLKLIVLILPIGLLVASIYLWVSGESSGGLAMLAEAFFIGLIFWLIFPRRYQVYEDHLRIVLGGSFAVKIGFSRIAAIEVTSRVGFTINFVTRVTKTYVRIIKRNGLDIAITPKFNDLFVKNANLALSQWARTNSISSRSSV